MITVSSTILCNVFYVQIGYGIGTSFCVNYKDKKYLVTARHMVVDKDEVDLCVLKNGVYEHQRAKVLFSDNDNVDIVVLQVAVDKRIEGIPIFKEQPDVKAGQELYFLGFPFGMDRGEYDFNGGYPVPFVKHAFLSCATGVNGYAHFWLDGEDNPGFSGGPVVYEAEDSRQYLLGVISSYRNDVKPVLKKDGSETEYIYKENSGIINAPGKNSIIDIIEKNM